MLKPWCLIAFFTMLFACTTAKDNTGDLNDEPNAASIDEAVNGPDAKDLDPEAVIPSEAGASAADSYTLDGPAPEPTASEAMDAGAGKADVPDAVQNEIAEGASSPDADALPSLAADPDIFQVTGKKANVRSQPRAKGKIVRTLLGGETVKVISTTKGWAKIGEQEYVSMKSLKK